MCQYRPTDRTRETRAGLRRRYYYYYYCRLNPSGVNSSRRCAAPAHTHAKNHPSLLVSTNLCFATIRTDIIRAPFIDRCCAVAPSLREALPRLSTAACISSRPSFRHYIICTAVYYTILGLGQTRVVLCVTVSAPVCWLCPRVQNRRRPPECQQASKHRNSHCAQNTPHQGLQYHR